ncbi:aminotransferase class IV family protein [Achromobacter pestifer]|uniref:Aminotransferase class IV family protein n=1 Tax=Achromobacter pestifer TaxID=1353889 RepID=A0A6S6ZI27_9BURK|nr:aminotransferase class IV family protein [Achromobacter pestifer]CAB3679233.1 hypothetical protein LMG3431_04273 [Achromobacter pestifer]
MSVTPPASFVVQRNAQSASLQDLTPLAFAGYAHFTAMQIRDGRVRGLDLHLARLRTASIDMFGQALPDTQILAALRAAIQAGPAEMSLVATVYSPAGEFTVAGPDLQPELLVRTSPPSAGPSGPLALAAIAHERMLPSVKHVGEVAKTYLLRQAVADGFDDAAFVDQQGRLSEASIWNLAFWDGEAVVWPDAAMLTGTTMGIVRRQLDRMGVLQRVQAITPEDVPALLGAVVMNSWTPGVPVNRIGASTLPAAPRFLALLHAAYQAETPVSP